MDEDRLPDMFFTHGDTVLTPAIMARMLSEFYAAMGWDKHGRPLKETLSSLDIDTIAAES
jgi:aldehyde:ferredoxin oxidoreductase